MTARHEKRESPKAECKTRQNRNMPLGEYAPSLWLPTVDNVRTILQRQTEYTYIPELSPQT